MRVNIYAEELTERLELVHKQIEGQTFTGLRFYLELPVTIPAREVVTNGGMKRIAEIQNAAPGEHTNVQGPFLHRPGDDDSSAVTFWGKRDLRELLRKALHMLDDHYAQRRGQS